MAHRCAVTGNLFNGGDEVICLICRSNEGELLRFDVLKQKISDFSAPGTLIGQWKRVISDKNSNSLNSGQKIANQEEFFLSLFEGDSNREKEILKQLFALLLEKKRVLRSVGEILNGYQKVLHIRSRRELLIPIFEIMPEELTSMDNFFEMFV